MANFQTVWPTCWSICHLPLHYDYELHVRRPPFTGNDNNNAELVGPPRLVPQWYNTGIENRGAEESRRFFLDRSVFDLVDGHRYLSLTDPKLLGWYLGLSQEDRKLILDDGGFHHFLQRHPALKLSKHHVYVKYDIGGERADQSTRISKKHRSPETRTCACDLSYTNQELKMLPSVKKVLNLLGQGDSRATAIKHSYEQRPHLQDGFQTAFSSPMAPESNCQRAQKLSEDKTQQMANCSGIPVCKDQDALASFSVDVELDRCQQAAKPELRSQTAVTQGQAAAFTHAAVDPLLSEWPTIQSEPTSEYFSFDCSLLESPDHSIITTVDEVSSKQLPADLLDFMDEDLNCHSVMEDDRSILACLPTEETKQSVPETSKPDPPQKISTAEKSTSTLPPVSTCDVMVGPELMPHSPASTQTEGPETSDKDLITEVHMADLDYLTEEFMKLKLAAEELRQKKEKLKSSGCKRKQDCGCVRRAQQAELGLVALQYSMCRQHCLDLYCSSAERDQLSTVTNNPLADISSVLQKLQYDFNEMRDQILSGVPLEELKPLSADSGKTATGSNYSPAQIIGDVLGNAPSCSQRPQKREETKSEEERSQSANSNQRKEKEIRRESSRAKRAVTLVAQDRNSISNAPTREGQKIPSKELNCSEAWYDAEEDLEPPGSSGSAEDVKEQTVTETEPEMAHEEAKNSVLFVSNLPSKVTENDVTMKFENYSVSEISISTLKNGSSIAIVMIRGQQAAQAAVRELNGSSMQGCTLHVELINRAADDGQNQTSASSRRPEGDDEPQTSSSDFRSTRRKLITQPPLSSTVQNKKVVCISPTAKGTCVPQHYCTMGSFDSLMTELTQRHPDVSRQRIVDALIELKAKHQGVLSGLPLRTIRDMTSELLTGPG